MYDFFKSFQEDKCIEKVKKVFFILFFLIYSTQGEVFIYWSFQMGSADILINSVFQFLDEISSNVSKESSGLEEAVVLKEGWVFVNELDRDQYEELMAAASLTPRPYKI